MNCDHPTPAKAVLYGCDTQRGSSVDRSIFITWSPAATPVKEYAPSPSLKTKEPSSRYILTPGSPVSPGSGTPFPLRSWNILPRIIALSPSMEGRTLTAALAGGETVAPVGPVPEA